MPGSVVAGMVSGRALIPGCAVLRGGREPGTRMDT
jgi:hypothetical protein